MKQKKTFQKIKVQTSVILRLFTFFQIGNLALSSMHDSNHSYNVTKNIKTKNLQVLIFGSILPLQFR